MKYSAQKLAKTLYQITRDSGVKSVDVFLSFCEEKNLNYLLPNILKYYQEIVETEKAKETVHIFSKNKFPKAVIDQIKKSISAESKTEVEEIVDEKFLGGFIAQYQNKTFDASVANQLKRLENKLINNS